MSNLDKDDVDLKRSQLKSVIYTKSFFLYTCRVKIAFFAREGGSESDLNANKVIDMINSGKAKELEENGFKVQSISSSKCLLIVTSLNRH